MFVPYYNATMKNILLCLALALCVVNPLKAQPEGSFTHYSSEDGLSENTVMDILQDDKGNMWFSTWNGINKFDGYTFKTFKSRPDNQIELTSNRVDEMHLDEYGFIWLRTYDERAFRFDPRTETFERVPAKDEPGSTAVITSIKVLPGGTVWLLTEDEGAIRVTTREADGKLDCVWYTEDSAALPVSAVHDVCILQGEEWVMASNVLALFPRGSSLPELFFESPQARGGQGEAFYAAEDCGAELFFGSDRGRVWRYAKEGGNFRPIQLPAASAVCAIRHLPARGEVVMATVTDGFFVMDLRSGSLEHYPPERLPRAPIRGIYRDAAGEMWLEQEVVGEVAHFCPDTRRLKRERLEAEHTDTDRSRPAFHIHEDCRGRLWVHPYGGGFAYYDRERGCLRSFYNDTRRGEWRFSNKIHSAYSDRQGNLWLCTHSKGLEKVTFGTERFRLKVPAEARHESLSNEVRALCEDRDGRLWVGLKDGRLRVYGRDGGERGYLTEAGDVARTGRPLYGNVYHIMQDSRGNLWLSTKGAGLVRAEPLQEGRRYRLTRFRHDADDVFSLPDDNMYCAFEDRAGRIWAATFAGGVGYLTTDEAGREVFISHRNALKGFPIGRCAKARCVTGDAEGRIWIGTTAGLLMVRDDFARPEDAVFHHYLQGPESDRALSNNDVHWILPTRGGELYVATFGGGLNRLAAMDEASGEARFEAYTVRDGLPSDILLSIREDTKGQLWISTENGLSRFTPGAERFENFPGRYGSLSLRFSEAASACSSAGDILFGTNRGILYFNPDSIRKSLYVPPVTFSGLLLANEEVTPGPQSVLRRTLDDTDALRLSHRENIFSIRYAALDYTAPADIRYAYMLEGFEKNWNYVGKQRIATYTNLPKGRYVFKVRSTNADGVWTDNTRSLPIEVLPSFWETPAAWGLYVLFFLLAVGTTVYILFTIYRLKHRVAMEHQLTDMKLRFFTDISHELRTPLTLISGPLEYVLQNFALPPDAREQLQVVERNTGRMLRLINQILDFRKIQNRKMKMRVQYVEVVGFTRKIMENFDSLAEEHHIDFLFEAEKDAICLWVDIDKYEKIVYNLLSNAFKYTPEGKVITVFIREDERTVSVGVRDQGIGIAESRKKSLFVRFENLVDSSLFNQSSSGIGLSLVRELVEMHKATVTVDSKLGEGSCFQVSFLKGKDHYDETVEILQSDPEVSDAKPLKPADPSDTGTPPEDNRTDEDASSVKQLMLLVEDNAELRLFLRSVFSPEYRVVEAADGAEGFDKALSLIPDIIISDVMMPRKDGLEMMKDLRREMTTSHIPLILLTAKTATENKLEGLEYGADDYITKPFSAIYLKARVKNILLRRQKLQELYRTRLMNNAGGTVSVEDTRVAEVKEPELSPNDRKFMDKLVELMEKNMDNGDLIVDDLVQEMAVSRSVFFKKLKTLTGLAPVEFIKEIRINRAVQLIETGEFSMTQIAYMVGINDPRYFSKCFKQKMGMTPTEYRESKKKTGS